jgi:hypothetical protein
LALAWFWEDGRRRVGEAFVSALTPTEFTLQYLFRSWYFHSEGHCEATIKLILRPTKVYPDRKCFQCPQCHDPCCKLYFVTRFACLRCQALPYRSQLVDKQTRQRERLVELVRMGIHKGRPRGMHNKTYSRLFEEFHALHERDTPRRAAREHSHAVTSSRVFAWSPSEQFKFLPFRFRDESIRPEDDDRLTSVPDDIAFEELPRNLQRILQEASAQKPL